MRDIDVARAAAAAAGEVIRGAESRVADLKGAVDPVTATDLAAEQAILEVLRAHRPDDAVLAEESGGEVRGRTWIADPLDGTVNFVHGIDHVAVSVGLWDGHEALAGAILDVGRDRMYWAVAGEGAWSGDTPLRVTNRPIGDAVVALGYPYDRRERPRAYGDFTARILAHARGVRRIGAAALDLAWVAEGRVDAYIEPGLPAGVKPWDVAAGILLVREAGGQVVNGEGAPAGLEESLFVAGGYPTISGVLEAMEGWSDER
ncbi:MAG: inositol monophosphatase [Acidimicrobiia bacterium]|nr:MAG: inositol monophosphatase [Acidimicrobiia bacterium]